MLVITRGQIEYEWMKIFKQWVSSRGVVIFRRQNVLMTKDAFFQKPRALLDVPNSGFFITVHNKTSLKIHQNTSKYGTDLSFESQSTIKLGQRLIDGRGLLEHSKYCLMISNALLQWFWLSMFFLVFSWRCAMQKWQNWWFYHSEESILEVLENDETTFIAHSFSLHLLVTATLLTLRGTPLVLEHSSFASKPTCICIGRNT